MSERNKVSLELHLSSDGPTLMHTDNPPSKISSTEEEVEPTDELQANINKCLARIIQKTSSLKMYKH